MPVSVAEFMQAAEVSGILTADAAAEYAQGVAREADAGALANRLVKAGRLTAFQARHIYGGKARSLVLGPYVVLDVLGRGGMGCVYKAQHRKMRRVVALKVISRKALTGPAAVQRFEREVQAAARLEHPNIVTAHDAGEAGGTHYLVMQFVDGRNLSEVVRQAGRQPVHRAVDWILQAARGLAFAHEQGVIHRDIKPGNLLVDSRGTVKILDMGLARLETPDADQDQLTGTGQIMGTVDYMAPEQAMDTRQADARSDIYALGATLWYLLTGQPLFAGDTAMSKMLAHMQTPAPALQAVRGDTPPEVDAVFQRMVAKKPADRFQSMQEVIAALQSLPSGGAEASLPRIAFGGDEASPEPQGTDATRTLQQPQPVAGDGNAGRPGGGGADGATGLKNVSPARQGPTARPRPLHLALGAGAAGILLVGGLLMFAVGGGDDVKLAGRGGEAASDSAARPASRRDSSASPADQEPAMSPRPEPPAPPAAAPQAAPPPPAVAPFDADQARKHQEAWAQYLGIPVETTNSIGATLVVIPPGRFAMGPEEKPTIVTLTKPWLLGQTEVTQGQWRQVMGTEPWKGKPYTIEGDDVAATHVSWDDADVFCTKLTELERAGGTIRPEQRYRLPTEAEWEFACRAGSHDRYFFGNDGTAMPFHGWFSSATDRDTAAKNHVHAVRLKRANAWSLYDTYGNAWEWVSDFWITDEPVTALTDPQGPPSGTGRTRRGGGVGDAAASIRSSSRLSYPAGMRHHVCGFRLALGLAAGGPPDTHDSGADR